jgi:hypothetical protein
MKKYIFFGLVFFFAINTNSSFAQPAEQKVLVTLQNGEEPMYSESCIPLSFTNGHLHLVTRANNQYYVYENGTRKGPFKTAPANTLSDCGENSNNQNNCAVRKPKTEVSFEKYVQVADDGQMHINYNGKIYTEFSQVTELAVSDNGTKIAALGTTSDWEPLFLTPDGKVIPLEGETASLILSPSGSLAIVTMKGTETKTLESTQNQMANMQKMAEEMQSVDFSKMTPEEMTAFSENLQKKYGISNDNQNNSPDYYLYLSNGKKIGPYKLGGYASDNPAFNISGADNWYFLDENQLFINGMMVKDFGDDSPSTCNVWISPDGKRYAAFLGWEKLVFSDGQSFQSPLQINTTIENGKTYLTWLILNSNRQIVLYKKTI